MKLQAQTAAPFFNKPLKSPRNGTYVLTHTTSTDGTAGKVETATFIVSGKDETFSDVDFSSLVVSAGLAFRF